MSANQDEMAPNEHPSAELVSRHIADDKLLSAVVRFRGKRCYAVRREDDLFKLVDLSKGDWDVLLFDFSRDRGSQHWRATANESWNIFCDAKNKPFWLVVRLEE